MSKKHFELLVKALADVYLQTNDDSPKNNYLFVRLLVKIGASCEKSNPRFDYWKFHNKFFQLIGKA